MSSIISWICFTNILCFASAFNLISSVDRNSEDLGNSVNLTQDVDILPGVTLHIAEDDVRLSVKMVDLFPGNDVIGRSGEETTKKHRFKKVRTAMMMLPFLMQLFSLPSAIASIKMSLLRSLFVGKLAIIMLIYNTIKNSQKPEEVVVVHQAPQHHDHYYHDLHRPEDDDDHGGWWGR